MSFDPKTSRGFVVERLSSPSQSHTFWFGPDNLWGKTYGGLDSSVAVFPTRRSASDAALTVNSRKEFKVWPVKAAIELAIADAERRREDVLAGAREDKQSIADANDRSIAYLRGELESA
jgi:hypothetical protein